MTACLTATADTAEEVLMEAEAVAGVPAAAGPAVPKGGLGKVPHC